jgi:arylsulfatase A-like enzyme
MRFVDRDIDRASPTIFELAKPSLGALSMIGRGLRRRERIGQSAAFVARAAATHFRGNVRGWLTIDRRVGEEAARRLRTERMRFAFIALTGIDKTSHAEGHDAQIVSDAMRIVDDTVAQIRSDAERDGRWEKMHLWVGSDHGHSRVREHEDLVALLSLWGYSTLAHPWAFNTSADIAVMVSGNAMTHLYLDIDQKTRPWWPALGAKWNNVAEGLLSRASVDLLILPSSPSSCVIRARGRGSATLTWSESRYSYALETGDPLEIGEQRSLTDSQAYDATIESDYPDALVQIAHLVASPRSGDIILSAARDWDYRARYEPIPHVSSHGALHREHMLVPLLLNRPPAGLPRRTVDVMPSALTALGIPVPKTLDGVSFF